MVNGYGEDNVLPHGRQFAILWFLTSHPIRDAFLLFVIFNLAASRIMKARRGPAREMRAAQRELYCELMFFRFLSDDGMRSTWLAIQMSLARARLIVYAARVSTPSW